MDACVCVCLCLCVLVREEIKNQQTQVRALQCSCHFEHGRRSNAAKECADAPKAVSCDKELRRPRAMEYWIASGRETQTLPC